MNAKDLLGKKIIDKKARDLAKLAEITINTKTFAIVNIFGSTGNPLSKKYYNIPAESILAIGDYIQVANIIEDLENSKLDKIPESEEGTIKISNLIGKTILDSEGNVAGKVNNIELNVDTYKIEEIGLSDSTSTFGKPKNEKKITLDDITSIGDYIIVNNVSTETEEEKEDEKVNVDVE